MYGGKRAPLYKKSKKTDDYFIIIDKPNLWLYNISQIVINFQEEHINEQGEY